MFPKYQKIFNGCHQKWDGDLRTREWDVGHEDGGLGDVGLGDAGIQGLGNVGHGDVGVEDAQKNVYFFHFHL